VNSLNFLPQINDRRLRPEIMDQPDLQRQLHHEALCGLERINAMSGAVPVLWRPIRALLRESGDQRMRMLDIATGAGDVPIGIWRKARESGVALDVEACDISPAAIQFAQRRPEERGADVSFFCLDAVTAEIPMGYDIVTCSLFLHHLEDDEAIELLRRMASAATRMILISDLVRSSIGWILARLGTRVLTTCRVVHVDGPRSVERAFTVEEATGLARRAGLANFDVRRHWPCRFLLVWKSSDARLYA
jgi:2-polyprenyl-3-methyl-5-hydroxy-6-metoxy-1,4-benzoquinol methylase